MKHRASLNGSYNALLDAVNALPLPIAEEIVPHLITL
jgi:hypothetical protein